MNAKLASGACLAVTVLLFAYAAAVYPNQLTCDVSPTGSTLVVNKGTDIAVEFVLNPSFDGVLTNVEGSCPCFTVSESRQRAFDSKVPFSINVSIDTSKLRLPKDLTFLFYTTPPVAEIPNATVRLIAKDVEQ